MDNVQEIRNDTLKIHNFLFFASNEFLKLGVGKLNERRVETNFLAFLDRKVFQNPFTI